MLKIIVKAVSKFPKWGWITIAAIFLCINIEFKTLPIPCCAENVTGTVNNIVLALSYSYIAAAIFHYIVNVIPYNRRKQMIEPFLKSQLWRIQDKFRLCKETIIPFASVRGKVYSKKEFCQYLANINLHEDCYLGKGKSKLMNLEELRESISEISSNLFFYREFLSDTHFQFINKVLDSSFISNGIDACPDVALRESIGHDSNQYEVGECIYDLYEYSKMINYETN